MKKEKGFVFTLDSIAAVGMILILASLFVLSSSISEKRTDLFELTDKTISDQAIMNFYFGKEVHDSLSIDKNFSACADYHIYDPDNGLGIRDGPETLKIKVLKICGGIH